MDLFLKRTEIRQDGIFGELRGPGDEIVAVTLEHAFPNGDGWAAKIPVGVYKCVRGDHYLHGMIHPFTTFEVYGVEGHAGILFHWGNFNKDSEGCILLGDRVRTIGQGPEMILNSRETFEKFMELQDGTETFQLTVADPAKRALTAA